MREMTGLNKLLRQGRMTWIEQEHGWVAAPEAIVKAFSKDGFEECNRETTTSRRDWQPPGGVWQGVDTRTGSVASAIWVNRPPWHQAIMAGGVWQAARTKSVASPIWVDRPAWDQAIVFIAVDGESFRGAYGHDDLQSRGGGAPRRDVGADGLEAAVVLAGGHADQHLFDDAAIERIGVGEGPKRRQ
jgi:hypothetical protein